MTNPHSLAARLLRAAALLASAGGAVALLSPGGLGRAEPTEVTRGVSVSLYRSLTAAVVDAPGRAAHLLDPVTELTLIALGLLLLLLGWTAVRRRDPRLAAGSVLTGAGTVMAYAVSEALKLVVDEERPCRAVPGAEAVAVCPEAGDWSFPSNHATLAAALATGLALRRPRLAAVTVPLAVAAALLRVLAGVHYPHDVLAGALLGAAVVAAVLIVAQRPVERVASAVLGRPGGPDTRFMGHDGGGGPVLHTEAGQDGADMRLDGPLHHMEPPGDLPVGQPAAEQRQHLAFPGGQPGDLLPGGGPAPGPVTGPAGREVRDHTGGDLR
ncbi:phosphatase PAP2 family protein [Streptomyces sp. SID4921]|nr:phosphatase PAP2 family protein [Streptomyces sp. SID4921]